MVSKKLIGSHEFKRDPAKMIFFCLIMLIPIGFLLYLNYILSFQAGAAIFTFLLLAFMVWMMSGFFKPAMYLNDECIWTKNHFGVVKKIPWDQVVTVDYQHVFKGKNSGYYFLFLMRETDNPAFTFTQEIHGGDITADDKQKIVTLIAEKLGVTILGPGAYKLLRV